MWVAECAITPTHYCNNQINANVVAEYVPGKNNMVKIWFFTKEGTKGVTCWVWPLVSLIVVVADGNLRHSVVTVPWEANLQEGTVFI